MKFPHRKITIHICATFALMGILGAMFGSMAQANSDVHSKPLYRVKTKLQLDGMESSPVVTSAEGMPVTITLEGKTALWEVIYTLNTPLATENADAEISLAIQVKRNHLVVAEPKLKTRNKFAASIKLNPMESSDNNEIELRFEPQIIQ